MADSADIAKEKLVSKPKKLHLTRGKRLGKYRLAQRLGVGGSCEVWKARDSVEGIWVALKTPNISVTGERDNKTLLREVRLITKLRHPNIMPVKNADIIDGYTLLATELSVGTLYDRSKPMSVKRIISIISQVLDGLSYAHRNRLVHCDVTPGNIFLFPNGRAALGDFGISFALKGRAVTIDDFGTPGYVAPEQAYGRPTYRSDCFSAALILYEYITGVLPRWPFRWPFRGYKRLRARTSLAFVRFMKKSLMVDPGHRFANAGEMLMALQEATPKSLLKGSALIYHGKKKIDWQQMRRKSFISRYSKIFPMFHRCVKCNEPITESMKFCPWCGTESNRFDTRSQYNYICQRCHRGILPEWRFCPWCYRAGFKSSSLVKTASQYYHSRCECCGGKLMRFMRYCPWCHRKVHTPWQVRPFPDICGRCDWSVDSIFWNYCPWCRQHLLA